MSETEKTFPEETKILVVDDVPAMRRTITNTMHDLGYEKVSQASEGNAAWVLLEESKKNEDLFGLVISDLMMPEMGGLELLKRVRSDTTLKDTPFIILTGHSDLNKVISAAHAKVNGYILKPFSAATLARKLSVVYTAILMEKEEAA